MTEQDLHDVKGLVHYLNTALGRQHEGQDVEAEVVLHSRKTGDWVGRVAYNGVDQYVFVPGDDR